MDAGGRGIDGGIFLQPQKPWFRDSRVTGKPFVRQESRFQNCFMSRPEATSTIAISRGGSYPLYNSGLCFFCQSHQGNMPYMGVFEELSWAAWHRCSFAPPKRW